MMQDGSWSDEWYKEAEEQVKKDMFSGEYYEAVDDEDLHELSLLETKYFAPARKDEDRNAKSGDKSLDVRNGGDS